MVSVDRISALPDELLIYILCFMRTQEAVSTTLLSKRWKNLWTRVPTLWFSDDWDFARFGGDDDDDRFARFVSRVLYFRDSVDIHKCTLDMHRYHDAARVDDWICTIVRRNVVEFEFVLMDFPIPQDLFMCKTLRSLKLCWYNTDFSVDPPQLGCFPNLKVFHAIVGGAQVPSLVKLYSSCPVLEVLTIEGIKPSGDDQVYDIEVTGPELKTLKVSFECYEHGDTSGDFEVYINVPKVENLSLRMDGSTSYFLRGSVKSLVNVSIAFGEFEEAKPPEFCDQLLLLLDVVSSVRYLSLLASWFKDWNLPAFGNLNQLELVLWDCNYVELLAAFLHSAPNLEDIVLVSSTKFEVEDLVYQWNPPEEVPDCLSSHLKTISITGFKGRQAEIDLAKYLLKNGPFLKKMTISTDLSYAEEDLYKEFSSFQRTTTCQVVFRKMQPMPLGSYKFGSWF